jgi:two-component system, sensor histidine kinase
LAKANAREYDVIFMDCHMPVMDGLVAATKLRSLERAQGRAPSYIVALTADVTAENRERCLGVGMNELAGKPISLSRLHGLIQRS